MGVLYLIGRNDFNRMWDVFIPEIIGVHAETCLLKIHQLSGLQMKFNTKTGVDEKWQTMLMTLCESFFFRMPSQD